MVLFGINCYNTKEKTSEFITGGNIEEAISAAKDMSDKPDILSCKIMVFEGSVIGKAINGKFKGV